MSAAFDNVNAGLTEAIAHAKGATDECIAR